MAWRDWTGVGERRWKTAPYEQVQPSKTLWDLLQLLIVPVILVGVSLWWNASQDSRDKSRAEQVQQDTTLNDYIQQMSDLMLTKRLLSSTPLDAVRSVARTTTLTTLRRLEGSRKGEVVRFLWEARLIDVTRGSPVRLARADLSFADLTNADLTFANLADADLADADLTGANLTDVDLIDADLTHANLTAADLTHANFTGADLTDADLTDAADLTNANFTGARLAGAKGLPKRSR